MENDPLAFFLTWVTYGTWLPGDERGWVEYGKGWFPGNELLKFDSILRMSESPVELTTAQRDLVESQIQETCDFRHWTLRAADCRTNHVHSVVSATDTHPKKIRQDLKAWTTRKLRQNDSSRSKWWANRGSIRWLFDEESVAAAIAYTLSQDRCASR